MSRDQPSDEGNTSEHDRLQRALSEMREFLERQQLPWEPSHDVENLFFLRLSEDNDHCSAAVLLDFEQESICVSVAFGQPTVADAVKEVHKFFSQLNRSLMCGSFNIFTDDGDMQFRVGFCFRGHELEAWMLQNALQEAVSVVTRYADLSQSVGQGYMDAEDAAHVAFED